MTPSVVDLSEKLARISKPWTPGIVAELNGQHVKLVKLLGEFVWHAHENEDEMFLVIDGTLRMEFRDRGVNVERGQFIVVPRGVEHRPVAESECAVMLFEPASTVNTGTAGGTRTVAQPEWL
ncbi:MAG TPA: cupin domain-containing protein [Opitutaceae bacterium]|nr:cupin domain-containing protein [Opitutaceae bacterium]